MSQIILGEEKKFVGDIFLWWYSRGIRDFFVYLKAVLVKITDIFSVKLLLRTYFAPWRRDIVSTEGLPLNLVLRIFVFNLIARLIGAFIKTIILFLYILVATFYSFLVVFLLFVWLFLPLLSIAGIILGVSLIISG